MLKKLLKHDFKALFKYWWIVAVVTAGLSALSGKCITIIESEKDLPAVLDASAGIALMLTYIGIIVFSLAIGFLFGAIAKSIMNKNHINRTIILVILTGIFYCPRTSSFRWISFLVYAQYYIPVIICFAGAKLLSKSYDIKQKYSFIEKEF